jgi:hypothetical protein
MEKADVEFINRRSALTPAEIQSIKQDIDRIVARGTALMANEPPLTDDDLYDENGL